MPSAALRCISTPPDPIMPPPTAQRSHLTTYGVAIQMANCAWHNWNIHAEPVNYWAVRGALTQG